MLQPEAVRRITMVARRYENGEEKQNKKMGDDLLSHRVSPAVPSALAGLTTLFGMGRGVSPPPSSPFQKRRYYSVVGAGEAGV